LTGSPPCYHRPIDPVGCAAPQTWRSRLAPFATAANSTSKCRNRRAVAGQGRRFDRTSSSAAAENPGVFTGLVEGLGRIEQSIAEDSGRRLAISWPGLPVGDPLKLGESVAINGCCLTVVAASAERFEVQAGPETLARTNLG